MSTKTRHPCNLLISAACALTILPSTAFAAGFQLRELSSEGVGNAFAGASAKATDLSTIYMNPAGMTHISGSQVQADLNYVMPSIEFSGTAGIGGLTFSGGDGGDAGEDVVVPAIYGIWDIGPSLKAGISLNVPFGLATKYDDDWVGRYFAIESEIENFVLTPSVAWKATDSLSLGAGIQIGRADATLSNAINLTLDPAVPVPDGMVEINGSDYGYGYTLGMLYEFTPTSRVGINYRSRMEYTLDGDADFDNIPTAFSDANPSLRDSDAEADLTTPDVLSLGAYHELTPKWAVMGEASWTNWSLFEEIRIEFADGRPDQVTEESWDDSWFFSLGADYRPAENHTIHMGLAFDESPVPDDTRTARIPDSDRYWVSLGYSYDFGLRSSLNLGYTHIFFEGADIDETTAAGTLTGDYDGSADIVSASLSFRF